MYCKSQKSPTKSPTKLTVIKEIEEYCCEIEPKLKLDFKLRAHSTTSMTSSNSTNIYDQQFLTRSIDDIIADYKDNPFFRAKLNYSLAGYAKTRAKSLLI